MTDVGKTRATPRKNLSRKYRPHALSNDEYLQLEEVIFLGKILVEVIAHGKSTDTVVPNELLAWLDELEQKRRQLLTMPKLTRLPRNTRVPQYTSVMGALGQMLGRLADFENMFLFSPNQCLTLAPLLFPNGFQSPGHGRLGSEEALLVLLATLRDRNSNFVTLGQTLGRDPDNLSRHVKNMIAHLDQRYGRLFDVSMLKIHADTDANGVARNVPIWQGAIERLFHAKFPNIDMHEYFKGVCLIMDGMRYDVARCSFAPIQEVTYSGYTGKHDTVCGVIIAPDGMVLALIGPYPGRHNDHVFCTPELQSAVRAIRAKILADGLFAVRDWLRPLPGVNEMQNYGLAGNQVAAASSMRLPVEWTIGHAKSSFPFAFVGKRNKILQTDVNARLRVSFLLRNLHTLMNGNNTSKYFAVRQTLSLNEYLARATMPV